MHKKTLIKLFKSPKMDFWNEKGLKFNKCCAILYYR